MQSKKKEIKNKEVVVQGAIQTLNNSIMQNLNVIITNDSIGKTISINNDVIQFTIPFEPIEKYLK